MPPRPSLRSRDSPRPLSAIYIGNQSNGNHSTNNNGHASSTVAAPTTLPDLPEPPSPVSSVSSGLPSPPATNSTGSGSTGDFGSIAVRRPPPSMASAHDAQNGTTSNPTTSNSTGSPKAPASRSSSRLSWKAEELHDDHADGFPEHDEDQTMRLKIAGGSSNESILQRARSLAQRNRLQLDKMASSRLGRASPSSSSSSRNNRHSMPDPPQTLSGSETERENDSAVYNSTSTTSSGGSKSSHRVRLYSAPNSPHRARNQVTNNSRGSSPTSRRRKRVSLASVSVSSFDGNSDDENENYDERADRDGVRYEVGTARDRIRDRDRQDTLRDDYDRSSLRAPTVNLNSLKKTTLGAVRRRSALPREFREGSIDEQIVDEPPQTPYRSSTTTASSSSTSTMSSSTLGRRSALRNARGTSEDLRYSPAYSTTRDLPPSRAYTTPINTTVSLSTPPSATFTNTDTPTTPASATSSSSARSSRSSTAESYENSPTIHARSNTLGRHAAAAAQQRERRQTLRGGSAESALGAPGGRSVVSEGLRAAGLSRRVGVGTASALRERERQRTLSANAAIEARERELDRVSLVSGSSGGQRRRSGENTPASADKRRSESGADLFGEGGKGKRVDWSPDSAAADVLPRRQHRRPIFDSDGLVSGSGASGSSALPPRASTSMADYSYTSRSRHQSMRAQTPHLESGDEYDHRNDGRESRNRERETDGGRESRASRGTYEVLTSREASLTRREQTLLERERELLKKERDLERERAGSVLGRYQGSTPTPYSSSTIGRERGHQQQSQGSQSEHARLMIDSLTMFESQLSKISAAIGVAGTNHSEMLNRNAQTLVVNAEKLNTMLRSGNSRALDAQIEAEVEGDYTLGPGSGERGSLVDVWRKIGGEYREGLRVSDELVRSVTGLLLGVGRVMKQVNQQYGVGSEAGSTFGGTPRGSPVVHGRSISLGEEEVRVRAGGGGVSPDFTGSRESRRSWEPSVAGSGGGGERGGGSSNASAGTGKGSLEETLRRLAGVRPDSPLARASPAFQAVRELDKLETASPGLGSSNLGLPKVNIPGTRRLFAPSQQREMALVAENNQVGAASDADYEPSPTPRTRILDRGESGQKQLQLRQSPVQQIQEVTSERHKVIPLPSEGRVFETPLRRNVTISGVGSGSGPVMESANRTDRHERRKISIASIATIRAAANNPGTQASSSSTTSSSGPSMPGFSTLTTPSGATTAITLDGGLTNAMAISRTPSGTSGSSLYSTTKPTFSRPEGITGLQQQLEGYRKRLESESAAVGAGETVGGSTGSDASGGRNVGGKGRNGNSISLITPESERETRRKTYGVGLGARISLDNTRSGANNTGERRPVVDLSVNPADRSAAATIAANALGRKERRRTVTDIWPRS